MDGLLKTIEKKEVEKKFSFKNYFVQLTTAKAITLIILIGLIVYFNSLFNGFVWEDNTLIINNVNGHSFNIFDPQNTFNGGIQFRPISALYTAILYSIFNNLPFFYHALQVIIHLAIAVLLFFLFNYFFNKRLSLFLSALFLAHPINSEAIVYIGAMDNPLFTLFGLLGFLFFIKAEKGNAWKGIVSTLLLLSLFSKETGILFFILIPLYALLFKRSLFMSSLLLSITDLLIYFFVRYSIGFNFNTAYYAPISWLNFTQRLINIPAIIFYYLKTFFMPIQLATNQLWVVTNFNLQQFYVPLALDLTFLYLLIQLGIYLAKTNKNNLRIYIFFLCWLLVGFGMYIQIAPLNQTVADHWFYFPAMGFIGLIGIGIHELRIDRLRIVFAAILGVIIISTLSIRTIIRNSNWVNTLTLFTHDSKISDNFQTEEIIAVEYIQYSAFSPAIEHLQKSIHFYPHLGNLLDLAWAYVNLGEIQKAEDSLSQATRTHSYDSSQLNTDLHFEYESDISLLINKYPQKALGFIQFAMRDFPNDGGLWADLAVSKYTLHDRTGALIAAEKAKSLISSEKVNLLYSQILNNQLLNLGP